MEYDEERSFGVVEQTCTLVECGLRRLGLGFDKKGEKMMNVPPRCDLE
jgi:hypothetical protein